MFIALANEALIYGSIGTKLLLQKFLAIPHPSGILHFKLFHVWRCHYDIIIGLHG